MKLVYLDIKVINSRGSYTSCSDVAQSIWRLIGWLKNLYVCQY